MDCTADKPIIDVTEYKRWPPCPKKPTIDLTGYKRWPPCPNAKQMREYRISVLGSCPRWPHRTLYVFDGLDQPQCWAKYNELWHELYLWERMVYIYYSKNPISNYCIPSSMVNLIALERNNLRDLFLGFEGVNSLHPAIPSIIYDQKCRLAKDARMREQQDLIWSKEIARIAALPKEAVPPPKPTPSADELARRTAQSRAAKRSNGIDYSISKRARHKLRDENSDVDDEYTCDPKIGYCGAAEPDWCTVCKTVTVTFGKTIDQTKVNENPRAKFA